ncbi:MAG: DHHA1 domain-containing protein [Phycisphaerae bacterium]
MSDLKKSTYSDAAAMIESWSKPLLVTHVKPDGDALGSLVAMRALLKSRGIAARAVLFDPVPDRYAIFRRFEPMSVYGDTAKPSDLDSADGIVLLDTCAYSQIHPIADWLKRATVPKLAVDHHVTRDGLADRYVIDESAAATCSILYDWTQVLGWPLGTDSVEALFVGIAMDTGWFRHANTDQRVFAAAADLTARGADPNQLYQHLYQGESPARIRLLGTALATLELTSHDRVAVMNLSLDAMAACGATRADTEDIVNEPLRIGSVVVSVLLVEQEDGLVRVSFRSKEPPTDDTARGSATAASIPNVDVAKVAQAFGGGGHARAAGARAREPLSEVRNKIVKQLDGFISP